MRLIHVPPVSKLRRSRVVDLSYPNRESLIASVPSIDRGEERNPTHLIVQRSSSIILNPVLERSDGENGEKREHGNLRCGCSEDGEDWKYQRGQLERSRRVDQRTKIERIRKGRTLEDDQEQEVHVGDSVCGIEEGVQGSALIVG